WPAIEFWRRRRNDALSLYLFSMGAPLFAGYLLYTLRARVQPNWIVPAVVPLFCLMAIHWHARWQEGAKAVRGFLIAGAAVGLFVVVLLHDTNLVAKVTGQFLPPQRDPLVRVRGWEAMAQIVEIEREKLQAEGKPAFVVGSHYGL